MGDVVVGAPEDVVPGIPRIPLRPPVVAVEAEPVDVVVAGVERVEPAGVRTPNEAGVCGALGAEDAHDVAPGTDVVGGGVAAVAGTLARRRARRAQPRAARRRPAEEFTVVISEPAESR